MHPAAPDALRPLPRRQAGAPPPSRYTWKDTVLYALGVGAKRDELDYPLRGTRPARAPELRRRPKFQPMLDLLAQDGRQPRDDRPRRPSRSSSTQPMAPAGQARDHRDRPRHLRHAAPDAGPRRHAHRGRRRHARRRDHVVHPVPRRGRPRSAHAPEGGLRPSSVRATCLPTFTVEETTQRRAGAPLPPLGRPQPAARRSGVRAKRSASSAGPSCTGSARSGTWCGTSRAARAAATRHAHPRLRGAVQAARLAGRHARHGGLGGTARRRGPSGQSEGARRGGHRGGVGERSPADRHPAAAPPTYARVEPARAPAGTRP